jgi:hypothetical protein
LTMWLSDLLIFILVFPGPGPCARTTPMIWSLNFWNSHPRESILSFVCHQQSCQLCMYHMDWSRIQHLSDSCWICNSTVGFQPLKIFINSKWS